MRVNNMAKMDLKLRDVCLSVCRHGTRRLELDGFSWNCILRFFQNMSRNFRYHYSVTIIKGTSHEDVRSFMTASPRILFRMRMF